MRGRRQSLLIYGESHSIGGSERFVRDLITSLDRERFDISLLVNQGSPLAPFAAAAAPDMNCHEIRIGYFHRATRTSSALLRGLAGARREAQVGGDSAQPASGSPAAPLPPSRQVLAATVRAVQAPGNYIRLRAALRQIQPDILHINNGGFPAARSALIAALAASHQRVPAVVHFVHSYPDPRFSRLEAIRDRAANRAVSLWATAADGCADALAELRGIPRAQIRTIHLGIDAGPARERPKQRPLLDEVGLSQSAPTIAIVASLLERKGHVTALKALHTLALRGHHAQLLIAGIGPKRAALERLAQELGVASRVRFLGWVDEVDSVLLASDALLMPSTDSELLPYSIKEAMACGIPVVASNVGAVTELVEQGVTGSIVAPGDVEATAVALARIFDDPEAASRLGANARERLVRDFALGVTTARVVGLYDEALAARRRRARG